MKGQRFSEAQIIGALKEYETGMKVAEICRKLGIVENTFYRWKAKYGGMEVSEARRLRELAAAPQPAGTGRAGPALEPGLRQRPIGGWPEVQGAECAG